MRDARYFVVEGRLYLLSGETVREWTRREAGFGWVHSKMPHPAFTEIDAREISAQGAMRLQRT
jgi:hypothetical protein